MRRIILLKWMFLVSVLGFGFWKRGQANGEDTNNMIVPYDKDKVNSVPLQQRPDWCIFRVPIKFSRLNEEAYTPQLVSLGPFHRGKPSLQSMEGHKSRLLEDFLGRGPPEKNREYYVQSLRGLEDDARGCYGEHVNLTSDEFVDMMLTDGSFIIEFMIQFNNVDPEGSNDSIFSSIWMQNTIVGDMELLENQLPFFVIEHLFNLLSSPNHTYLGISFLDLTLEVFSEDLKMGRDNLVGLRFQTFVDLFRQYYIPSPRRSPSDEKKFQFIPTATELHDTGIRFKTLESGLLLDVTFSKHNGVLNIPRLKVQDSTEVWLRNIISLEQFHSNFSYITDYMTLMDSLVNTQSDVALLRDAEIIDNWLGDDKVVADMFNNLGKGIFFNTETFYYAALFEDVNAYYKKRWNFWRTKLRRDYFNTPWSIISFAAATVALICQIIQTVGSGFRRRSLPTA